MIERSAVTVGTFDGVHLGHQKVLRELLDVARERGERSVLVTFDPHPLKIVRPEHAPRLLTTPAEKEEIIGGFGIDVVAHVPFTYELSQYEPARFVREILIGQYGLAHLVIGYDHGFGKGRSGDVETLREIGAEMGFEVDVVEPYQLAGDNVSSSKIRAALGRGDVRGTAAALGRPYSLRGVVVRGDGRGGAELDMPTANLEVGDSDKLIPFEGIYAVRGTRAGASIPGRSSRSGPGIGEGMGMGIGVAHIGPRPSIPGARDTIEVHFLDFSGDLYDEELDIRFIERIRDIEAFGSMSELKTAMHADARQAREILSGSLPSR